MKFALLFVAGIISMIPEPAKGNRLSCHSFKERNMLKKLNKDLRCREPTRQLLSIPVPDGYDYVYPSMMAMDRCEGMMCHGMNQGCIATETKTKTVKVEAKMENGLDGICMEKDMEVHVACGCGCAKSQNDCTGYHVLDAERCKCVCPKEAENDCTARGGGFMWHEATCSCKCTPQTCPAGAFVMETCKCMRDLD